jgi:ABC-type molybdate transport system substrate-binding protein
MLRTVYGLIIAFLAVSTPASADTLKVMDAGSLRAAVTDLLHRFPVGADTVETPEFGASGLMRQKIENGAAVDVFASADMEQPHQLAAGHPERFVILCARNSLCALAPAWVSIKLISWISCSTRRCELRPRHRVPIHWEHTAGRYLRARMRLNRARARRWKQRQKNWSAAERKRHLSCLEREPSKEYSSPTRRTSC